MIKIIGVDPGKTTGVFIAVIHKNKVHFSHGFEIEMERLPFKLHSMLKEFGRFNTTIVCESYPTRPATEQGIFWSAEVTGIFRSYAIEQEIEFKQVMPSNAKRLITNDVLKRMKFYHVGSTHIRDAARMVGYYCVTELHLLQDALRRADGAN